MSFYTAPHEMPVQPVDRQPSTSSSKRKQLESQYTQGTAKKRRSDVYDDDADDPRWARTATPAARGTGRTRKKPSCSTAHGPRTKTSISMRYGQRRTRVSVTWVHFLLTAFATVFTSSYLSSQCALDAFGGRKTFLAVKGCYERNFVVFKQIYAFETFTVGMQQTDVDSESEVDRLREYERRIYAARKAGFHVGKLIFTDPGPLAPNGMVCHFPF
jgi:hypothetical protein